MKRSPKKDEKKVSNYTKHAELARDLFRLNDTGKIIKRFDLRHDADALYLPFFGRELRVDRKSGRVTINETGEPASFNTVMSVYDVLCNRKDGARITGEWKTLQTLSPHSNFGASGRDLHSGLAESFEYDIPALRKACELLGGEPYTTADVGYKFDAFEFLPIVFQLWLGDDEFPSRVSFLLDAATLDFMHFETAWYVAGELSDLLMRELDRILTK